MITIAWREDRKHQERTGRIKRVQEAGWNVRKYRREDRKHYEMSGSMKRGQDARRKDRKH